VARVVSSVIAVRMRAELNLQTAVILFLKLTLQRMLHMLVISIDIVTCYPDNTSSNLWVADFVSQFIGSSPSGITITHNTSNLISHKPVTSSGSEFAPSWRKPLLRSFRDELL
jgi:hypothetical protein